MAPPLFLLRCPEIGLSIRDLDYLTIGMVMDIWNEKGNDSVKYDQITAQEDNLISFDEQIVNFIKRIAIVRTYRYNMIRKISERWCFIWQQNQLISMLVSNRM